MSRSTVVALTARREDAEEIGAARARQAFDEARLTVQQAAEDANVSAHTIRRAYESQHLIIQRFGRGGRNIRIRRADLMAWLIAGGKTGSMF